MKKIMFRKAFVGLLFAFLSMPVTALAVGQNQSGNQSGEQGFELNLQNADIRALINMVSKSTGKNFVIHPSVRANNITVVSNKKMNAAELYDVFLSVLQVHGYSAVPSGDVIKIVLDSSARQQSVPLVNRSTYSNDQLITRVIPVNNVSAVQIVPILRPLIPNSGHLAAYPSSNQIVITDRRNNINRILKIIQKLDKPDNSEVELLKLEHASAKNVVAMIKSLKAKSQANSPSNARLASDDRSNSVLISGSRAERERIKRLIKTMDVPLEKGGNTQVVYLKYAKAKSLSAILKGVNEGQKKAKNGGKSGGGFSGVDIQADEETNALVITADPSDMQEIQSVIEKLDIRRAQIHVEAIIAELTDDTASEFGFSYVAGNENKNGTKQPAGVIGLGAGGSALTDIAGLASGALKAPTVISNGFTVAFGEKRDNGDTFGGVLRALAADGKNNILSTPSIVTIDNQEAEIIVGQNVPFITGTFTTNGNSSSNPFQTVERKDVGIKLKIKPQINEGNAIQLQIEQEVSDAFNDAATGQLITNKRNINTNVLIEDGQMLVLGGLIDDQEKENISKVPLLGDIPLLGRLFQYRSSGKKKRNLMVFIHPTIIKDRQVADYKTAQKYNFVRENQEAVGSSWFSSPDIILPELNVYFDDPTIQQIQTPEAKAQMIHAEQERREDEDDDDDEDDDE